VNQVHGTVTINNASMRSLGSSFTITNSAP
jgi:hypothetical protein